MNTEDLGNSKVLNLLFKPAGVAMEILIGPCRNRCPCWVRCSTQPFFARKAVPKR